VGNFTDPEFAWQIAAHGGIDFNSVITHLRLTSTYQANYTVSNLWIGGAEEFFGVPAAGDFNADGVIDAADLVRWKGGFGIGESHWHGDTDADADVDGGDFLNWQRQAGATSSVVATPEPRGATLALLAALLASVGRRGLQHYRGVNCVKSALGGHL
jgi:hypothetical protein